VSWILSVGSVRHALRHSIEPSFDQMTRTATEFESASDEEHPMSITLQAPVQHPHAADINAGSSEAGSSEAGYINAGYINAGARVRLTRRGRVVVLTLLIGLMLAAFTVGRSGESRAATEGGVRPVSATTTVHAGETLWAVAHRVNPGRDPRALVQAIRDLNHLSTAQVHAGQQLLLPRRG
jgi:hypothetical protein